MDPNQEDASQKYLKGSESTLQELNKNPLIADILRKAEPIFKRWIFEVLKDAEPVQEESATYLSRKEVCKLLKISLPTLSKYYKIGIIQGVRVGSRILFTQGSIKEALKVIPYQRFRRC